MAIKDERKVERFIRKRRWKIRTKNFKTYFSNPADQHCNGGITYCEKTVYINSNLRRGSRKRLYVLLHEAGHMLAARLGFAQTHLPNTRRDLRTQERYAALLGLALAQHLKINVPRNVWRSFNWEVE